MHELTRSPILGIVIGLSISLVLWALIALIAAPAWAGLDVPPAPVDLTAVNAAIAQAAAAQQQAQAIQAAIPPVCTTPPSPDGPTATAGTGTPCTPRADATRQTPIPQTSTVTLADGSFSGTWPMTLTVAPSRAHAWIESAATPYLCQVATRTATGYTGKCWALVVQTLPLLPSSLLGLVVSPIANPAAGLTVNVLARQ